LKTETTVMRAAGSSDSLDAAGEFFPSLRRLFPRALRPGRDANEEGKRPLGHGGDRQELTRRQAIVDGNICLSVVVAKGSESRVATMENGLDTRATGDLGPGATRERGGFLPLHSLLCEENGLSQRARAN